MQQRFFGKRKLHAHLWMHVDEKAFVWEVLSIEISAIKYLNRFNYFHVKEFKIICTTTEVK